MSTQRRGVRFTLATKISRLVARLGFRLLNSKRRASGSRARFFSAPAQNLAGGGEDRTAPPEVPARAATKSLPEDHGNEGPARLCPGSPPVGEATARQPISQRSRTPVHFPAENSRFHRSLPWVPAAAWHRTERYDGKRDLHFQHAA